jgi:hypothetical protein
LLLLLAAAAAAASACLLDAACMQWQASQVLNCLLAGAHAACKLLGNIQSHAAFEESTHFRALRILKIRTHSS